MCTYLQAVAAGAGASSQRVEEGDGLLRLWRVHEGSHVGQAHSCIGPKLARERVVVRGKDQPAVYRACQVSQDSVRDGVSA